MHNKREQFNEAMSPRLDNYLNELIQLQEKKEAYLNKELTEKAFMSNEARKQLKEKELRKVNELFQHYTKWYEDSMQTEDKPYLRIVCVVTGC
nr:hypothetical protein [Desulfobulbaceae bacterium]